MIHLDIETYSECDLNDCGSYVYARHPTTEVMCASWWLDPLPGALCRGEMHSWVPGDPPPPSLINRVRNGHKVKCHNVAFDAEIWRFVLAEKYGWWWPGYDMFLDSMAQAQITNLPGKLEQAAKFFGSAEKDMAGSKLMQKLCKPARITKNLNDVKRHHTPENCRKLVKYCEDDVRAERGFSRLIPNLSKREDQIWRGTWGMNRRGVSVDNALVLRCSELAEKVQLRYRGELIKLTGGDVHTENQRPKLAAFMEGHGASFPKTPKGAPSFAKDTAHLIEIPEPENPEHPATQALDLYNTLNSSSIAKFRKMLVCQCPDGRLRGMFCYSGAGQTGRDAGRLVQLQNLPRGVVEGDRSYEFLRSMIMDGCDFDELELCYGSAMDALASAIRMCLVPAPGKKFVVADYSAIEGRVLAWMAGEMEVLQCYMRGMRMYAVAAAMIHGCPYEQVVAEKKAGNSAKDKEGKVAELACGYQGSWRAIKKMGGAKLGLTVDRMKEIVAAWRAGRQKTVDFWASMNDAALTAMNYPMKRVEFRNFRFGYDGNHLKMQLPSGRCLWYRRARVGQKIWPDGGKSPQLEYYGVDDNKRVGWINTYGGKLTENADQAVSRDIMMDGALRAEEDNWPLVMRVHDELVAEIDEDDPRDHNDLCGLMRTLPDWASSIPIDAAGWQGAFYKKD